MAYPPPPYKDSVVGTFKAGEAKAGTYWAYPPSGSLKLGSYVPNVYASTPIAVPRAGLSLGSYLPNVPVPAPVPSAPLRLGSYAPRVTIATVIKPPQAGLSLGTTVPNLKRSSTFYPFPAGLGFGRSEADAYRLWLLPSHCTDLDLVPSDCVELNLTPAAESELDLEGAPCL